MTIKQTKIKYGFILIVLALIIALLVSCNCDSKEEAQVKNPEDNIETIKLNSDSFFIVKIKGCNYIVYHSYNGGYNATSSGITHQANCLNPIHNTSKEVDSTEIESVVLNAKL